MSSYKHWKNLTEKGGTVFVTTTVLDFVPVFSNPIVASRMEQLLIEIHKHYNAKLYAYVVMPEHIHLVTSLPAQLDDSEFVRRLKAYSAKQLMPMLDDKTKARFNAQSGLNQRSFWQRSFRGFPIESREVLIQKIEYIHLNPVRRQLVEQAKSYLWSSAKHFDSGNVSEELGVIPNT